MLFKLTNVGPLPIYNIEINKKLRTFSLGTNQYSTVSNKNIWKFIPILKPEDSVLIDVPSDDINRVIHMKNVRKNINPQDEGDVLPILYYTFDFTSVSLLRLDHLSQP